MSNPVHSTLTTLIEAVAEAVILKTTICVLFQQITHQKKNGRYLRTHIHVKVESSARKSAPFRILGAIMTFVPRKFSNS